MTTTFAELRQDLSTQILTIGGDWNASPVPYHLHGPGDVPDAVPASKAHLSFSIGFDSSAGEDRQRAALGALTLSGVSVRFFARYTPRDGLASEDAALDHERDLIAAAIATDGVQVLWESSSRDMTSSGEWFVHESRFQTYHRLPLT